MSSKTITLYRGGENYEVSQGDTLFNIYEEAKYEELKLQTGRVVFDSDEKASVVRFEFEVDESRVLSIEGLDSIEVSELFEHYIAAMGTRPEWSGPTELRRELYAAGFDWLVDTSWFYCEAWTCLGAVIPVAARAELS